MNLLVMIFVLSLAALVQAVIPSSPLLGQAQVPAIGAVVVYYALARKRSDLIIAAIVAGVIQDGMGLIPFGYSSLAFGLVGVLIARFKEIVFVHEVLTHMLFGLLMASITVWVTYILLTSTGLIELPASFAFLKMCGSALLGALVTPLIFRACAWMDQLMGLVESSDSTWHELP